MIIDLWNAVLLHYKILVFGVTAKVIQLHSNKKILGQILDKKAKISHIFKKNSLVFETQYKLLESVMTIHHF